MKAFSFLLIPSVALLVSGCAMGPGGPGYAGGGGYGPGPDPRSGYYWNGSVYIEGQSPYYRGDENTRNLANENDVNVNRTTVNDRTVNDTTVDRRTVNNTNVNDHTVDRTNVNQTDSKKSTAGDQRRKTTKLVQQDQNNPPAN